MKNFARFCGIVLFIASSAVAYAEDSPAIEVVKAFYKKLIQYNYHQTPNLPRPKMVFSKSFSLAIEENARICAEHGDGICGWAADFNEYYDAQETDPKMTFENSGIEFKEISKNVIQVKLNVYPSVKNDDGYYLKKITYKMLREDGLWVVDDIVYTDGLSSRESIIRENENNLAYQSEKSQFK